jgi:hypothetical protein
MYYMMYLSVKNIWLIYIYIYIYIYIGEKCVAYMSGNREQGNPGIEGGPGKDGMPGKTGRRGPGGGRGPMGGRGIVSILYCMYVHLYVCIFVCRFCHPSFAFLFMVEYIH